MVAYTAEFCLPYFEGSDSPCVDTGEICAPSTVWCDMAAKINDALVAFDVEIDRAVASFPYAQVAVADGFVLDLINTTGDEMIIFWDTVVGDSDGMVNIGVDPTTVFLRRSGIWNLNCILVAQSSLFPTSLQIDLVHPGAPKITPTFTFIIDEFTEAIPAVSPPLGISLVMDWFYEVDVSTGPVPLQIKFTANGPGGSDNAITVAVARFSARWMADLS